MFKNIKYFIQRGKRGYSDMDLWGFDEYLCEIIPPALRQLAKNSMGCSNEFFDKDKVNDECWKWREVLETIAQGFEAAKEFYKMNYFKIIKTDKGYSREIDEEKQKQLTEKYDKGMELFAKYFMNFWD